MDATETTLDGKRLGRYRIIRKLGAGGMADVYLAEDESMGREVALKVLPPEFARNPESVARFQKEVRAAARLSHPHIVTVYDVGDARIEGLAWHYYAMQVLPGGDLKARIEQGVSEQDALTILSQIASALKYAHEHGIVHRDIKPENILFSADGQAILTDLGIAKAVGSGTRMTGTGMSIGTPHYMSPEQARGQDVDGRSDLYALGVLLHEMLTGTVPYDAADTFAIGIAHISEPIPQLPAALSRYQRLLNTLMAKQLDERFADAGELLNAIETLQQGGSFVRNVSANEQEHVTASAEIPNATRVMPAADDDALVGANKGANTGADNDTNNGNNKPGLSPAIWGLGGAALAAMVVLAITLLPAKDTAPVRSGSGGAVAGVSSQQAEQRQFTSTETALQMPLPRGRDVCREQFGASYRITDWQEIKVFFRNGGSIDEFISMTGISSSSRSRAISVNGEMSFSRDRHYFVAFHNHQKPGSFLAHDHIDNYLLSLGSWSGTRKVMCSYVGI